MKKAIGIDLGGTSIGGGLIDEKGNIIRKVVRESEGQKGRKAVLNNIIKVIRELMDDEVEAIGIGSPGTIDYKEGKVLSIGGNIKDWSYTDIRGELSKNLKDIPIFVENDGNVALICENWLGAGKGLESLIMITLGTGVGGSIYSKKSGIWHGKNYQAAELGHMVLYPEGIQCICGQRGCVERYISGSAIEDKYFSLSGERLKGKDIFKKASKDEYARETIESFIRDLGIFLITIKNVFDPEGIIIGGGVINSKEYWWDKVIDYFNENCNNPSNIKILPARFLNDAGIIGAAKFAFDSIDSKFY